MGMPAGKPGKGMRKSTCCIVHSRWVQNDRHDPRGAPGFTIVAACSRYNGKLEWNAIEFALACIARAEFHRVDLAPHGMRLGRLIIPEQTLQTFVDGIAG